MTTKGQLTVPIEVRNALRLEPGTRVQFVEVDGYYQLRPATRSITDLSGCFGPPKVRLTIEEMNEAITQAAADSVMESMR
jgi:AbrB family looped-hinge helix DNA binding protein